MGSVIFLDPLLFQNSSTKIPYESYFNICGRRCALHGSEHRGWGVSNPRVIDHAECARLCDLTGQMRGALRPGGFGGCIIWPFHDKSGPMTILLAIDGDPGTWHDPAMEAPCKAPAPCRDSIIHNAHVVPTLQRI
jgi:hypothetical protein